MLQKGTRNANKKVVTERARRIKAAERVKEKANIRVILQNSIHILRNALFRNSRNLTASTIRQNAMVESGVASATMQQYVIQK